jgi:hypothetical protein
MLKLGHQTAETTRAAIVAEQTGGNCQQLGIVANHAHDLLQAATTLRAVSDCA